MMGAAANMATALLAPGRNSRPEITMEQTNASEIHLDEKVRGMRAS